MSNKKFVTLNLRITQDVSGNDHYTEQEIINKLRNGEVNIHCNKNKTVFFEDKKRNHKIMAVLDKDS
jgi:hypothetical protein